jgi:GNAT superfamily N-acetyltransferase
MSEIKTREMVPDDEGLVMDSWLRSFRPSWFAGPLPNDLYYDIYRPIIRDRVRARSGARVLVATDTEDTAILGWMCFEGNDVVHYIYVKDLFRKKGVARALIQSAGLGDAVRYTFRTKAGAAFASRRNWTFNPDVVREVK